MPLGPLAPPIAAPTPHLQTGAIVSDWLMHPSTRLRTRERRRVPRRGAPSPLWGKMLGDWKLLAVFLIAGSVLGGAATLLQPRRYEASAIVWIRITPEIQSLYGGIKRGNSRFARPNRIRNLSTYMAAGILQRDLYYAKNSAAFSQFILSHALQADTAGHGFSESLPAFSFTHAAAPGGPKELIRSFASQPTAIRISAVGSDPAAAAAAADLYAQAYVEWSKISERVTSEAQRESLSNADSVAISAATATSERLQYLTSRGVPSNIDARFAARIQLDDLDAQIAREEARRQALLTQINRTEQGLTSGTSYLVPEQLRRARERLDVLLDQLDAEEPRDPASAPGRGDNGALRAEIESVRRQIRSYTAQILDDTPGTLADVNQVLALQDRLHVTEIALDGLRARQQRLLEGPSGVRTWTLAPAEELELEWETQKHAIAEQREAWLNEQLQSARVIEAAGRGYAEVFRHAALPSHPLGYSPFHTGAVGLALGAFAWLTFILFRSKVSALELTPAAVQALGLPVVASLAELAEPPEQNLLRISGRGSDRQASAPPAFDDAFARLRVSLKYASPDHTNTTYVLTGLAPGDGASAMAIGLATFLAGGGQRTLLVDANLDHPCLHDLADVPRSPGFTDAVRSRPGAAKPTRLAENLDLLPAGTAVPDATAYLQSDALTLLLDHLSASYDAILFDTPALEAGSDAALLAAQVDQTIIVATSGAPTALALADAVSQIRGLGGHMLGIVLNRVAETDTPTNDEEADSESDVHGEMHPDFVRIPQPA